MHRLKKLLGIAFATHVLVGLGIIVLILLSSGWTIGEGRFSEWVRDFETFDWRWVALVPAFLLWATPIAVVLAWNKARDAGLKADQLREVVGRLLEGKQLPIRVEIDEKIAVRLDEALKVPVELDASVPIDQAVDVEAQLPVRFELPIDSEVETRVFGIGAIKIPIRARVPIDIVLPVKGTIRVRAAAMPVQLRTEAVVRLPPFVLPISARIETRVDLLENLKVAESRLRKTLAAKAE
jgi:hypothetical protein